jgi:hypothetical protein
VSIFKPTVKLWVFDDLENYFSKEIWCP